MQSFSASEDLYGRNSEFDGCRSFQERQLPPPSDYAQNMHNVSFSPAIEPETSFLLSPYCDSLSPTYECSEIVPDELFGSLSSSDTNYLYASVDGNNMKSGCGTPNSFIELDGNSQSNFTNQLSPFNESSHPIEMSDFVSHSTNKKTRKSKKSRMSSQGFTEEADSSLQSNFTNQYSPFNENLHPCEMSLDVENNSSNKKIISGKKSRLSLQGFAEEEKKERVKKQNNLASKIYRHKKKEDHQYIEMKLREEEKINDELRKIKCQEKANLLEIIKEIVIRDRQRNLQQ